MINITTGGAVTMTLDERAAAATRFSPELCSMNMGSMNFGIFPIARGVSEWRSDWEEPYLESSKGWIFKNTFTDVEELVPRLAAGGTRFEFECYDIGHLYNLAHFLDRGIVEPPLFVQSVMGILGGIGTHSEDLMHMKRTADRLFGDAYRWSVLGAGRHQVPLTTNAAMLGAAASGSASRTRSTCGAGCSPSRTRRRSSAPCGSWASSRWSRRPRTRRARSSA